MIEGDNLEVLKLLQKAYAGRVKLCFIDPPYNTGRDFVYNDSFRNPIAVYEEYTGQRGEAGEALVDRQNRDTSGRFHTDWLNMIYARLLLARELLREDGVIAISIDDVEIHNLRHVCDGIFGSENFVGSSIWRSRTSISNDKPISPNHNHIIFYARSLSAMSFYGDQLNEDEYSNPDNDERGPWKLVPIDANKPGGNTQYPIKNPKTGEEHMPPNGRSWSMNPQEFDRLLADGRIKFGMTDDSSPKRKLFLLERQERGDSKTPSSVLITAGTTKDGTEEMMELFDGKKVFDYPKPVSLMERLLDYVCDRGTDNLVLDFFAGSGSVGEACMSWKAGKCRYILVQIPLALDQDKPTAKNATKFGLKTIADITKERLRRAGKMLIKERDVVPREDEIDTGFRVFKLDTANVKAWEAPTTDTLEPGEIDTLLEENVDGVKLDRTEEDLLWGAMLNLGLPLDAHIDPRKMDTPSGEMTVYVAGAGTLLACFAKAIDRDSGEALAQGCAEIIRAAGVEGDVTVLLRDSAFGTGSGGGDDAVKVNLVENLRQHAPDPDKVRVLSI
jgi:adenine-specific DNA-methyltransferase